MLAILLALGAALSYGLANYLAPVLTRQMPLAAVLIGGQLGGLMVSLAVATRGDIAMSGSGLAFAVAAGVANAATLTCYYRAGRTGDLSVVAPIGATGAIVPVLVGFGSADRSGAGHLIAIPLTMIGIVLAAGPARVPAGGKQGPGTAAAPPTMSRGIGWALLAALLLGVFLTSYAKAADDSSLGALLWSRMALVATTAAGIVIRRPPARVRLRHGPVTLVPGGLLTLGTFVFGEATRVGPLSVASVIATLHPVVTVILAIMLLGERPAARQRLGVLLAVAGVVLLAAS